MSPFAFSDFPKTRGTVFSPSLLKYDTLFLPIPICGIGRFRLALTKAEDLALLCRIRLCALSDFFYGSLPSSLC